MLQNENIEEAIHMLEDLVEATKNLETPTFPRDLNTAIEVVDQTLAEKFNTSGHKMNKVSHVIPSYTYYIQIDGEHNLMFFFIFITDSGFV